MRWLIREQAPQGSHTMVGLRSLTTGNVRPLEFVVAGVRREVMLPTIMSVTGTESYLASARLGLGLVQIPRFYAQADLTKGTFVQVLPRCCPPSVPVSLLYPRNRQLSLRVRVFSDWVRREFDVRNTPAFQWGLPLWNVPKHATQMYGKQPIY